MGNDIRKHLKKSGKVGFEAHGPSTEVNTGLMECHQCSS